LFSLDFLPCKSSPFLPTSFQGFLQRHGKDPSSLLRKMLTWLGQTLPAKAKDDTNKVDDWFAVIFKGMVLSLSSTLHRYDLEEGIPLEGLVVVLTQ